MINLDFISNFIINEPTSIIKLVGGPFTHFTIYKPEAEEIIVLDFNDLDLNRRFQADYKKKGIESLGVWRYEFIGVYPVNLDEDEDEDTF